MTADPGSEAGTHSTDSAPASTSSVHYGGAHTFDAGRDTAKEIVNATPAVEPAGVASRSSSVDAS